MDLLDYYLYLHTNLTGRHVAAVWPKIDEIIDREQLLKTNSKVLQGM